MLLNIFPDHNRVAGRLPKSVNVFKEIKDAEIQVKYKEKQNQCQGGCQDMDFNCEQQQITTNSQVLTQRFMCGKKNRSSKSIQT